jgi:hypothetical protein
MSIQIPIDQSYNKVITTIKSCQTKEQLEGASNMVKNFKTLYRKVGYPKVLSYSLDNAIQKQHTICQL